ncbi:MAG: response regulator [Aquabacterium sp.]|nr:response regulator [Aquabacterium sp.]
MGQACVLITDDDATTLEMLDAALQDQYQITTTSSGREALTLTQSRNFDLVLLDVDMPDLDGYATCLELKASSITADVPVIFLSARVNLEERLRGYRVGASDYLTKPFDVLELTTKIKLVIEQRERNQRLNSRFEEAMNTAQTTADMYGEVGVVLQLQRRLSNCQTYEEIASSFFDALRSMGLEGCLRLTGRQGVQSSSAEGECNALSNSILDHLERAGGATIQAVGDNTSFNYGKVLMLVRNLPMNPPAGQYSADELDRLARARDNIAMLAEGIVARLRALDIETEKSSFEITQKLISATREALLDISAQQHANRMQMGQVFQRMRSEVEQSFIHLGLTERQEEHLASTLQRHVAEALGVFDHSNQIEAHLKGLIAKLNG